jgi:oligopeptide/dipeptide ABC transporter ATP-binding protein
VTEPLLAAQNLVKRYPAQRQKLFGPRRELTAVDDVSLALYPGETFGLVGESGCGKTTLSRLLLLLEPPTHGQVLFAGRDANRLDAVGLRAFRRAVQAVFQDPYSSLSPRQRVGAIVGEPMLVHERPSAADLAKRVDELLRLVGLTPALARVYPHELSGGQRQRVAIARALSIQPRVIVLDEPVSSLDVSIRAQILNLLRDLQRELGLAYLFISHDLAVVQYLADRVGVMYLGRLVEAAPAEVLFARSRHPYTRALMASVPGAARHDTAIPTGEVASPLSPPPGCRFHPRCPLAAEVCFVDDPALRELGPGHSVACHFAEMVGATTS